MAYKKLFRMPTKVKITARSSSLTNSFVNSVIPVIPPSEKEIENALNILGMDKDSYCCVYCGDTATEWDHLNALVRKKNPTGYISEIQNLVPACGKCNQSKGNSNWKGWMLGDAKRSPKSRQIPDIQRRIELLERYEAEQEPTKIDFRNLVTEPVWDEYWQKLEQLHKLLNEIQPFADDMARKVLAALGQENEVVEGPADVSTLSSSQNSATRKASAAENIFHLELFKKYLAEQKVGENDEVASSINSYVSYLNSIANRLSIKISPSTLGDMDQLKDVFTRLSELNLKSKTLGNLRVAARHYVQMCMSTLSRKNG